MKRNIVNIIPALIFGICTCCLSCKEQDAKMAATKSAPPIRQNTPAPAWDGGPVAKFSVADTASLKCYIHTYRSPYLVKIFGERYVVHATGIKSFIAKQQDNLRKYRVYILSTRRNSYSVTREVTEALALDNIRDFEVVEDGKPSR